MGVTGGRGAHLVRVTVLAVAGLVVALCLPSMGQGSTGQHPAGDPRGSSTGVAVRGVGDSG